MRDICGGRVSKVTLVDPGLAPVVGVIAPQLKTPRKSRFERTPYSIKRKRDQITEIKRKIKI
jgi:hypothetical protein